MKKFSNVCPVCRSEEFAIFFNKQADRAIRSLHIFCTNKEQGCEWQGEVNDISGHLGNCVFQVINCPNKCGKCLQRQLLTTHVEIKCPRRTISCQYCNDVGENQFIEGQHKEKCPKFPVQCPNECKIESIHRDEVEEHKKVCPLEMIQCDYHVVGCTVKMARKDMNTHKQEMMEKHLSLSINELMEIKMQLKSSQNNRKYEVEKTKDDFAQQLVWHTTKITDIEQQLMASQQEAKKTKDELTRMNNHCSSTIEQLTSVEQATNTQLENLQQQLTASQLEVTKIKEDLTQQIVCTQIVTAKLTDSQQEATRKKDQLIQELIAKEMELNITKQQLATTCQYLTEMEDKIQAKIDKIWTASEIILERDLQQKLELIVSPWFMSLHDQASRLSSGDQIVPVVVKVAEFTNIMKGHGWLSQPFYHTHDKECQLQLKVVTEKFTTNGSVNTYVSVSLLGDYKVHSKHKRQKQVGNTWLQSLWSNNQFQLCDEPVIVKLLNQISNNEHITGYLQWNAMQSAPMDSNVLYCNPKFISYTDLQSVTATNYYLKNDTLFFEVLTV